MNKPILTLSEASALLDVHPNTMRNLIRKGVIPAAKINKDWRFVTADVVHALRKLYPSQAQSAELGDLEAISCQSTSEAKIGTSTSQRQTEKSLDTLLARKTGKPHRSTTTP